MYGDELVPGVKIQKPSKKNILEEIDWLMGDAEAGDSLFFSISGHGKEGAWTNGDEKTQYDQ